MGDSVSFWLTKQQLIGLAVVAVVGLLVVMMLTVLFTVWLGIGRGAEEQPMVAIPSHIKTLPTPTTSLPVQIVSAPDWYQPETSEIFLPTSVPAPEPTSTVVHLAAEFDFTPVTPLIGWPVGGQMTQGFGCTPNYTEIPGPNCPDEAPWFHGGVDIGAVEGTPVRAAMAGRVVFAGPDRSGPTCGQYQGYGLTVMLDNGQAWQTLYAHLSQITVEVDQQVLPETIIGAVGQTGCATGPHLHFGLRYQGTLLDASSEFEVPGSEF